MNNDEINNFLQQRKGKNTKEKKVFQSWLQLENGQLVEQVVARDGSKFAIFTPENNSVGYKPAIQYKNEWIYPLGGDLVNKKVILFPSEASEYGSTESLRSSIKKFIHTYVDVPEFYEDLSVYYVLLSWLYDRCTVISYLGISGDYGTGKTRAAQVVGSLCYKPAFASGGVTCAPIYRLMEFARGTLIINEFDFKHSDMGAELIKILNNGYEKGMSVLRVKQDKSGDIEAFDAFGPKIFTYRLRKKDDAFESRLITIPMQETSRDDIPTVLPLSFYNEATEIRNKLLMFRFRHYYRQSVVDMSVLEGLEPRLKQTLYPLVGVVDDDGFKKQLREFAENYQQQKLIDRAQSWVGDYVQILVDLIAENEDISMKQIADKYNEGKLDKSQITSRRAGSVMRDDLKLSTVRATSGVHKGKFIVVWSDEQILKLCTKYGIEIPENHPLYSPMSTDVQVQSGGSEHSEGIADGNKTSEQMSVEEIEDIFN